MQVLPLCTGCIFSTAHILQAFSPNLVLLAVMGQKDGVGTRVTIFSNCSVLEVISGGMLRETPGQGEEGRETSHTGKISITMLPSSSHRISLVPVYSNKRAATFYF